MRILGYESNLPLLMCRPLTFLRAYWLAEAALLIGAALDAISTIEFMLAYGTVETEAHPAVRLVARMLGVYGGVILATILKTLCAVFVAAIFRRWTAYLLILCGVLYALGAASNHFGWFA